MNHCCYGKVDWAETGYVWNSVLYSDKDIDGIDYGNGKYHATHIVC